MIDLLLPIQFQARTTLGGLIALVVSVTLSLAFWGALTFIVAYAIVRGIAEGQATNS